jgi:hypothetical protein
MLTIPDTLWTLCEGSFMTSSHFPHAQTSSFPDCRKWWLYAPAKCYRMMMRGDKEGIHPDMASYPNFPGFTKPFLEWYVDVLLSQS